MTEGPGRLSDRPNLGGEAAGRCGIRDLVARCHCDATAQMFDPCVARREMKRFRRRGPPGGATQVDASSAYLAAMAAEVFVREA